MFFEVELIKEVAVSLGGGDKKGLISQRSIVTRLLKDLLSEKVSKDHGYFLAITSVKSIDKREVQNESGDVLFRVTFKCRTFMPYPGEILEGVVHIMARRGVFLRCGPLKYAFLSARKMPDYYFLSGENPVYFNEKIGKIELGIVVRFRVLAVRWMERRGGGEFKMLASIEGDGLGPVSSVGPDEMLL